MHHAWILGARACEGHPRSTSGANGSQMGKHFTTRGTDFTKETFYKLRMGLCSTLPRITNVLSVLEQKNVENRVVILIWQKKLLFSLCSKTYEIKPQFCCQNGSGYFSIFSKQTVCCRLPCSHAAQFSGDTCCD